MREPNPNFVDAKRHWSFTEIRPDGNLRTEWRDSDGHVRIHVYPPKNKFISDRILKRFRGEMP